jgi:nitrite reductase/ring-hydroxylating ferredoxin subunit
MSDDGPEASLGDLSDLRNGEMRACRLGGLDLVVCRVDGELHALEDLCSHADTTLSDGLLNGHVVTCPLHGAQFDVRDGRHLGPPAWTGVRCFTVTETADGVRLGPPVVPPAPPRRSGPPGGYFRTR